MCSSLYNIDEKYLRDITRCGVILVPRSTGKVDRLTYELTRFIPLVIIVLLTIVFYIMGHNDKRNQDVFVDLHSGENISRDKHRLFLLLHLLRRGIVASTGLLKRQFCACTVAFFAGLRDEVALGDTDTFGEESVDLST